MTLPLWDICAAKHGGNAESVEANRRNTMHRAKQQRDILEYVKASGSYGITCKEAALHMGCHMNAISGRFTELCAAGLIKRSGEKRDGCAVWVAALGTTHTRRATYYRTPTRPPLP